MTKELSRYLEMAYAGPSEKKRLVQRHVPKELAVVHDGKTIRARELLLTEAVEATNLIQTEVYKTILEGANQATCFREVLPVVGMKGNSFDWPIGESGYYAVRVPEGAEIPRRVQEYSKRTFTAYKETTRPEITREMIEDCLFDVVEAEVRKGGKAIENKVNRDVLTTLLDNAGNEHDTGGSNQGVKAVAGAIGLNKADDFGADVVVMHPDFASKYLTEFVPTAYAGASEVMKGGSPGFLGMKPYICSVTDNSDTYTWDYDTDGEIGALVLDSSNAGAIGVRRDISVEDYKDPIHDLQGMTITTRVANNYLHANAICRIEY